MKNPAAAAFICASAFPILASSLPAAVVTVDFAYSQTSAVSGSGTIGGMLDVGGEMVNFTGTMPQASVFNANPLTTQAGAIGAIDTAGGDNNAPAESVGIYWTTTGTLTGAARTVTLTGMSGANTYTVDVLLQFVDLASFTGGHTYTFQLVDDGVTGGDAVGSPTLASFLGSEDTNTGVNRQTFGLSGNPGNPTWGAGPDSFTRTFTDESASAATGGAGPLGLYVGWRNGGSGFTGTIAVDQIDFSGLLSVDEANIMLVPEPSSTLLLALGAVSLLTVRRRG